MQGQATYAETSLKREGCCRQGPGAKAFPRCCSCYSCRQCSRGPLPGNLQGGAKVSGLPCDGSGEVGGQEAGLPIKSPPTIQKKAEASASDASQFRALKLEAAKEDVSPVPVSIYSETLLKLKTMLAGTNAYHEHMQLLSTQAQNELEVILSRSPRALWRLKMLF